MQEILSGNYVKLRDVEIEDAEFILSLRCDDKKSKFLHKTENNLEKQKEYLKKYKTLNNEWYFIVERKDGQQIGTYRIYDLKNDSFCIGSWLMIEGCSPQEVMETDYLVREFGFKITGFDKIHFDVRKENKKVLRYHQMTGSKIVGENDIDYFLTCMKSDYLKNIERLL